MPQQIKIFSAGLSEQDNMAVNTAAKLLSYESVDYQINNKELVKAHLLIVDEDSQHGKQAMRQSRPGQVKLIVSSKPMMAKNTIGLPRPIDLNSLKLILKKLYEKLQQQLMSQQMAAAKTKPDTKVEELKESILNVLLETKLKQRILHITCNEVPDIFIDGCNQCLATTATESEFEKLCKLPIGNITLYKLKPKTFAVHSNEMNIQSLHNLLWLAGIKCSNGKILPGNSIEKPFRLRAWPNFTRNSFIAEHLKLAAILAKQPNSIRQLSESTGVNLAEVINFFNAAYAVDLIDYDVNADKASPQLRSRTNEQQGLFSRIAQRLNLEGIF